MLRRLPLLLVLVMGIGILTSHRAVWAADPTPVPAETEEPTPSDGPSPTEVPSPEPTPPADASTTPSPSTPPDGTPSPTPEPSVTVAPEPSPATTPGPSPAPARSTDDALGQILADPTLPAPRIPLGLAVVSRYALRAAGPAERPYYSENTVPAVDTGLHDAEGVRMVSVGGVPVDHPVAQAQYALLLLNTYRVTGNPLFLDRAVANAERLIERAVVARDAWYFPYPFDFTHGVHLHAAPWFSGMAQGQALSVFVRLGQLTGDVRYLHAADWTFNSFLQPPDGALPWTVMLDTAGELWIEEYPQPGGDFTLNGHVWATYGLYDYWSATGRQEAYVLTGSAIGAAERAAVAARRPGAISRYCLKHGVPHSGYHLHHTLQLMQLYTLTGAPRFAQLADAFFDDHPDPRMRGTVRFLVGVHTAHRFDSQGRITATMRYELPRSSQAPAATRARIPGRDGFWLRISAGVFSGYWVRESPTQVFLIGIHAMRRHDGLSSGPPEYLPSRRVTVQAGSYRAYRYDPATGAVLGSKPGSWSRPSVAYARQVAIINGRPHARIVAGTWAGYWLPIDSRVSFD